jgi:peptidyl-prolyl cis-trans isomerase D
MRQTIQNVGLLVIVLALSAVFLLQFGGPQAEGCASQSKAGYAAKVYGDSIPLGEMKTAYGIAGGTRYSTAQAKSMKLKELVLDGLIERELLVREAKALGFEVTQEDVMRKLAEDSVMYVSAPVGAPPMTMPSGAVPIDVTGEDGNFSADQVRRYIQNGLGRTIEDFADSQVKETLALRMREVVMSSASVSPAEVWEAFVREKDKAEIKYVRFDPSHYKTGMKPTKAELDAWVKDHQKEVDAEYEKEKHRFTGLEKQVRARHILFKVEPNAEQGEKDTVKARAELARGRAVKGEDFAELATELSEDTGSAKQGGDLGFNTKGKMVAPFDDAQFALKPGEISQVVETRYGYHVIKVEAVREGDVPLDEAKRELAEKQLLTARGDAQAKKAADALLAALAGGETIEAVEERLKKEKEAGGDAAQAPLVKEARFGRGGSPIPGVDAGAVVAQAFEMTTDKPLPEAPVKAGESYIVFKLVSRETADKAGFEGAEKERLTDALLRRKRGELLEEYVRGLRKKADAAEAVRINPDAIAYGAGEETASL